MDVDVGSRTILGPRGDTQGHPEELAALSSSVLLISLHRKALLILTCPWTLSPSLVTSPVSPESL